MKRVLSLCMILLLAACLCVGCSSGVVRLKADFIGEFREGLATIQRNGQMGCVDVHGKEVIPCQYWLIDKFCDGLAAVLVDSPINKYGYIDKTGAIVIPCTFDSAGIFEDGLACVRQGEYYGFIDKTGQFVIPCEYERANSFCDGLAAVKKDGKWGFVDTSGNLVIPCRFQEAYYFSEGLAGVVVNGKCGYIDRTGTLVISCGQAGTPCTFSDGIALVILGESNNSAYCFIDTMGRQIGGTYRSADSFSGGLAAVEFSNKRWGYIDTTGNCVIPAQFDYAVGFHGGYATVRVSGKYGVIDTTGSFVVPPEYDELIHIREGIFTLDKDNFCYICTPENASKLK